MKKKWQKLTVVALSVVMCAAILGGCGSGEKKAEEKAPDSADASGQTEEKADDNAEPASAEKSIYDMTEEELIEAAKQEGSVTFGVWHDEALWKEIGQGFTEKYGIEFNLAIGEKQALISKVIAEKDGTKGTIDVIKIGGEDTKTIIDAKALMGPTLPYIWAKDELDAGLSKMQEGVEHGGYLVPMHRNQTGILIDPKRVENPPQTWEELAAWIEANPKQFGFCDPSKGGSGQAMVFAAIGNLTGGYDKYYGDTELDESKIADWADVWTWFNDRKDIITITTSNKDSMARLNQGEIAMTIAWDDQTTSTMKSGELFKDAKLYIPTLGLPGGGDTAGILNNAQHPAAGLLLLNYFTSVEAQAKFNEVLNTYPARTDVEVVNTSIDPADFVNRTEWIPAQYKTEFINKFVENVLMTK